VTTDRHAPIETAHAPGALPKRVRRSWFRLRRLTPAAVWLIVHRTAHDFVSDHCTQMAAAIAYGVLFAIIPVAALAVATFGMLLRLPSIRELVVDRILENVPLQAGLVIDGVRAVSTASEPLTLIGAFGLLWTTVGMIGVVRDALNVAWGVRNRRHPLRQKLFDVGSMLALGFLLAVSILGTVALHNAQQALALVLGPNSIHLDAFWQAVGLGFPGLVTFVSFLFLYRYVPNVKHGFADVWPGALVASGLFELAKHAFAWYVSSFDRVAVVYGALGAVMLFLVWIYVSALILLLGAEMASVYEKALRGRTATTRPYPDLILQPRVP
jgi:membrane protein